MTEFLWILGAVLVLIEIVGLVFAVDSIMQGRTPQGTLAWCFALIMLPIVAVPFYLVFGSRRFAGYVKARRKRRGELAQLSAHLSRVLAPYAANINGAEEAAPTNEAAASDRTMRRMIVTPCTRGNRAKLLLNGKEFFNALIRTIDGAAGDVLVQFYIINDDVTGRRFKAALLAAAARGVKVRLLYDIIGCSRLPRGYRRELAAGGVLVAAFRSSRAPVTRLQINFRNHRKLLVADGNVAITGGLNIGDEYDDKDKELTPWRDTAIEISGPAALEAQLSFVEDWHFATGKVPSLPWEVTARVTDTRPGVSACAAAANARVVIAPTGPADEFESGALLVLHLISRAQHRLWIATPYFVPNESIVDALRLAVLRGVDVRVMVPRAHDQLLMKLAMMSFDPEMMDAGVKMLQYQPGFMHQKVILSDDLASVGSMNLDNRSMRINFELTAVVADTDFIMAVVRMLENDFEQCKELSADSIKRMKLGKRVVVRLARLLVPVL